MAGIEESIYDFSGTIELEIASRRVTVMNVSKFRHQGVPLDKPLTLSLDLRRRLVLNLNPA